MIDVKAYCGYLFLMLLSCGIAAGEMYQIVNKDGSITYTDIPTQDAQAFNLSSTNSAVMPSLTKPLSRQSSPAAKKSIEKRLPEYSLQLVSPLDKESIRNNAGKVSVRANLTPTGKGQFQLFLDSVLIDTKSVASFELGNVERGEHHIQIKFIHNSGKILASTPEQVFYLHKASALIKAN